MHFSRRTRKALLNFFVFVCISTAIGGFISLLRLNNPLRGAFVGFFISATCGVADGLLFRRLRSLPFTLLLFIKSLFYTLTIISSLLISGVASFYSPVFYILFMLSLFFAALITFIGQVNRLMGQKVLMHMISGTYHRPTEEERVIMFLDMRSSTMAAEKLGNLKFHTLLNRCFYDLTDSIIESGGEIYKYLGDGIIITWNPSKCFENATFLTSFFCISEIFKQKSQAYLKEFDYVPSFRAGVHIGLIVIGELGDFKKEIAFLGDAVNTTARIEAECSNKDKSLIVSEDVLNRLTLPTGYIAENLGNIRLRGKDQYVKLFAIESNEID
jgi:adenylate cyclase